MKDMPPPEPQPLGRRLGAAVFAVVVAMVIIVASAAAPFLVARLTGHGLANGAIQPTWPFFAVMIISQVIMALGAFAAIMHGAQRWQEPTGFAPPIGGARDYWIGLGLMIAVPAVINAFRYFVLGDDLLADLRVFAPLFKNPLWPIAFLVIAAGAPIAEEFLFRGYLQSRLRSFGFATAAIVPTLLWAGLHIYSIGGMVLVVTMGVLLARMRDRTGSLRVPIAAHAANNALVALFLQFGPALN